MTAGTLRTKRCPRMPSRPRLPRIGIVGFDGRTEFDAAAWTTDTVRVMARDIPSSAISTAVRLLFRSGPQSGELLDGERCSRDCGVVSTYRDGQEA